MRVRYGQGIVRLLLAIACLLLVWFPLSRSLAEQPGTQTAAPHQSKFAFNQFLVDKPHFTLPFSLVNIYIMLAGQVDQTPGKFMFDTGTADAFLLNRGFLPLAQDVLLSKGRTASGQVIAVYSQNQTVTIELADQLKFANQAIRHGDFQFIQEALEPKFLGFAGYTFSRNYLFVINYDQQIIDFYSLAQSPQVLQSKLPANRIITTLQFTPRPDAENLPEVMLKIGRHSVRGFLDTGNPGSLTLTEQKKKELEQSGSLICRATEYSYGLRESRVQCSLKKLSYNQQPLADLHNLTLNIGNTNQIGLGYQFLKHYVTAWNYQNQTITLLQR